MTCVDVVSLFCLKDFAVESVRPVDISTPVNGFKIKVNVQILPQI